MKIMMKDINDSDLSRVKHLMKLEMENENENENERKRV